MTKIRWGLRLSVVALVFGVVMSPDTTVQAGPGAPRPEDAVGQDLSDIALSSGALGVYFDPGKSRFVVIVPSSNPSAFTVAEAAGLGADVTIEVRDIDQSTIDTITTRLERMRTTIPEPFAYGFGFDPVAGVVLVQSEAPEELFAQLEADFPGKIDFHPGKFYLASMHSDSAPFSGGADLNGEELCTSGFTMRWSNGTKRMVTAGHCFSGVGSHTTNMGTGAYGSYFPDYDIATVSGSTYAGYVWTANTTKRPVSDASNPIVGWDYCISGRSSGVKCQWEVTQLGVTICYFNNYPGCAHSLAAFKRYDDSHILNGDSGGPLWLGTVSDTGALAVGVRGVISGFFWDIYTFSWRSYATQYNQIATQLGGSAFIP